MTQHVIRVLEDGRHHVGRTENGIAWTPIGVSFKAPRRGGPGRRNHMTIERGHTTWHSSASSSACAGRSNHISRTRPARTTRAGTPSRSAPVPAARPLPPLGAGRSARATHDIATSRSGLDRVGRVGSGVLDTCLRRSTPIDQFRASRPGVTSPSGAGRTRPLPSPLGALIHLPGVDPGTQPRGL